MYELKEGHNSAYNRAQVIGSQKADNSPSLPCPSCSVSASKSHLTLSHRQLVSSKALSFLQISQ